MQELGDKGRTVLLVSHNVPLVSQLCHRTILMEKGRIIADGRTSDVVSQYLHLREGAAGSREWPDRTTAPGNEAVRLRAVRVRNEQMLVTSVVDITKSFSVELEYEVLKPGLRLAPHIALVNEESDILFTAYESREENGHRPIGKYTSQAVIPGNLLTDGTFFVNANCRTLGSREVDIQEHGVIALQIIEGEGQFSARGNIGGPIPGVIRPMLQWRTTYDQSAI
jgi:lipopolysaccharide transport system ATP-binding protein